MQSGFEEKQQNYQAATKESGKYTSMARERVIVGKGGRLVIPVRMRKAMGIEEGEVMVVRVEEGELIAVPQQTAIAKIQDILKRFKKPDECVVDEFIAERYEEQLRNDRRFDRLHGQSNTSNEENG